MFKAQKFQFRLHFTLGCGYLHEIEIFSLNVSLKNRFLRPNFMAKPKKTKKIIKQNIPE